MHEINLTLDNKWLDLNMQVLGCVPPDSAAVVVSNGLRILAQDYFLEIPEAQDLINNVFENDPDKGWVIREVGCGELHGSLYEADFEVADAVLKENLKFAYRLVNLFLSASGKYGFNDHGELHIDNVFKEVIHLLQMAGASETDLRIGTIAARGHDIANVVNRDDHAMISAGILLQRIPELRSKNINEIEQWEAVRKAIELHDEPFVAALVRSWGKLSEVQIIERMREVFGIVALALIVADKWDIGPHRLSYKAVTPEVVEDDLHFVVNNMIAAKELRMSEGVFTIDLEFHPGVSEEEAPLYEGREALLDSADPRGRRKLVPKWLHDLHNLHNISHFDSVRSLFWKLYFSRIKRSLRAIFALFPDAKETWISFTDAEDHENVTYKFTLENFERDWEAVAIKHNFLEEERKDEQK